MSSPDKTKGCSSSSRRSTQSADQHTRRLALSALFAALAMIFSYVEALIPMPVPVPGIKLGIANLVIVMVIYKLGFRYALSINCIRIVISGLLFSGIFGMIYSFAGGLLSITVMYVLHRTKLFSMVGISMAGGVMHNLGQLFTACLLMSTTSLMSYFPVLLFSGMFSGIFIGILAHITYSRLPDFNI